MIIRYCSDLHLEFSNNTMDLPYKGEDVLVLAGDITVKNDVDWIIKQSTFFPHVVYIDGNHEYYNGRIDKVQRINAEKFADYDNIHYGNNESVTIDGVTFHISVLWTDFNKANPISMSVVENAMNDYRIISYHDRTNDSYHKFSTRDALREHYVSKVFLTGAVKEGDVVVTHMAPTMQSIHQNYRADPHMNGGYASDLSDLILDNKPALWFHGHVHNTFDYLVGDTRVLCNPRGYVGHEENPAFDLTATVEI